MGGGGGGGGVTFGGGGMVRHPHHGYSVWLGGGGGHVHPFPFPVPDIPYLPVNRQMPSENITFARFAEWVR